MEKAHQALLAGTPVLQSEKSFETLNTEENVKTPTAAKNKGEGKLDVDLERILRIAEIIGHINDY